MPAQSFMLTGLLHIGLGFDDLCVLFNRSILVRINLPLFSTVVPASIFMFLFCRPFVAITTLSTGLVGVELNSAGLGS